MGVLVAFICSEKVWSDACLRDTQILLTKSLPRILSGCAGCVPLSLKDAFPGKGITTSLAAGGRPWRRVSYSLARKRRGPYKAICQLSLELLR
jgi:hypothetical protein